MCGVIDKSGLVVHVPNKDLLRLSVRDRRQSLPGVYTTSLPSAKTGQLCSDPALAGLPMPMTWLYIYNSMSRLMCDPARGHYCFTSSTNLIRNIPQLKKIEC